MGERGKKHQVALPASISILSPIYSAWWDWSWAPYRNCSRGHIIFLIAIQPHITIMEDFSRYTQKEPWGHRVNSANSDPCLIV